MIRIAERQDAARIAEIYRPHVEGTAISFEEDAPSALLDELGFTPLCRLSDTAFKLGRWQAIDWMELTLRGIPALPEEPISFSEFARARPGRLAGILGGAARSG